MSSKVNKLLVAAIDIGTNYSGCAFSFKHEYEKNPTKVQIRTWSSRNDVSNKQASCVLCKPGGTFHSFGYDAESKYFELAERNEHHKWYFFRRFKLMLYATQVNKGFELEDEKGLKMPAKKVFAMAIRYLKDDLLCSLQSMCLENLRADEIHWVLPVPTTWSVSAKEFLREAANEAGIDVKNLTIALEPEAAVMYCQLLLSDHLSSKEKFDDKKYIVIILGGETVHISVHEKKEDGSLNEVYKASSLACGGDQVNEEFKQVIIKIFGATVFKKFCEENVVDYIELCNEFERKKRRCMVNNNSKILIMVPFALKCVYEEESGKTIEDAIAKSPYRENIQFMRGKLIFDPELFRSLFQTSIRKITYDLFDLLEKPAVMGLSRLIMVGGFSECQIIQAAVMKAFPKLKVFKPDEAGVAVLKGAAILGHTLGIECDYNFPLQTLTKKTHSPMFANLNDDDVSSDDIASQSTCSSFYEQGICKDQTRNLKSSSEEREEFLSSDYLDMRIETQDKNTSVLETQLKNQMTLKADIKRAPSDDELFVLSRKLDKLNKGWWLLAKLLGLSDEKIDEMEHAGGDTVRQYYKMLTTWKKDNAGQEKGSVGYLLRQCDEAGIDREVTHTMFGN